MPLSPHCVITAADGPRGKADELSRAGTKEAALKLPCDLQPNAGDE